MTTWTRTIRCLTALALASFCLAARAGEITAYTSLEEDDVKVYLDAFNKAKPGIKVNVLRLSTGDLAARMLAEKSNPRHDVIWGWAVTQMVDPRFLEMAEPYRTGTGSHNGDSSTAAAADIACRPALARRTAAGPNSMADAYGTSS